MKIQLFDMQFWNNFVIKIKIFRLTASKLSSKLSQKSKNSIKLNSITSTFHLNFTSKLPQSFKLMKCLKNFPALTLITAKCRSIIVERIYWVNHETQILIHVGVVFTLFLPSSTSFPRHGACSRLACDWLRASALI